MAEDITESDFCFTHRVNEPLSADTYSVCKRCNHVFQTEKELVDETNVNRGYDYLLNARYIYHCPFCRGTL